MVVRKLPDMPYGAAPLMRGLREARRTAIANKSAVRPFCPVYKAADEIRAAVDRLAEMLTGDDRYFSEEGSSGGGSTYEDKLAREAGRLPWRSPTSLAPKG